MAGRRHAPPPMATHVGIPCTLAEDMRQTFRSGRYADVQVTAGGETFPAHRAILYARCPYFREALGALEADDQGSIAVDGISAAALGHALEYIYTGQVRADPTHSREAIVAGKRLSLERLVELAEAALESEVGPATLPELQELAIAHGAQSLMAACERYIAMLPESFSDERVLSEFVAGGGLPSLVHILENAGGLLAGAGLHALMALQRIAEHRPSRDEVASCEGIVPLLLNLMGSDDDDVRYTANNVVHEIGKNSTTARRLCEAGAVEAVVDSMLCNTNLMLVESAATALASLLQAECGIAALDACGGLEATVDLLASSPTEDLSLCAPAVAILSAVAKNDAEGLRQVSGASRVAQLVQLLCERRALVHLLHFVSHEKLDLRRRASCVLSLISKDCVPSLVQQMMSIKDLGSSVGDARARQEEAVGALSIMAQDVACFEAIVASGGVDGLLDLLTVSERFMEAVTYALAGLSSHEACVQRILESGSITILVSLLSSTNVAVQENATRILVNAITHSEPCADAVCEAGGLQPLVHLLLLKEDRSMVANVLAHFSKASLAAALAHGGLPSIGTPQASPTTPSKHMSPASRKDKMVGSMTEIIQSLHRPSPRQTGGAEPASPTRSADAVQHHDLQAIHEYAATDERMLSLREGEIVRVVGEQDGWLYAINCDGEEGYVPPTYLGTPTSEGSPVATFEVEEGALEMWNQASDADWMDRLGTPQATPPGPKQERGTLDPLVVRHGRGQPYSLSSGAAMGNSTGGSAHDEGGEDRVKDTDSSNIRTAPTL